MTRRVNQARHGRSSGDEADLSPGGADGGTARASQSCSYSWEEIDFRSICVNVLLDYSSVRD